MTPKAQKTKAKIDKVDYIKPKDFCPSRVKCQRGHEGEDTL
jgi:hypothetical protein